MEGTFHKAHPLPWNQLLSLLCRIFCGEPDPLRKKVALSHQPRQGCADAADRLLQVLGLAQIAQAQIALARLAEGGARREAHIGLVDEPDGDVLRVRRALDLQEGVEGAARRRQLDETGLRKPPDDVPGRGAALAI